MVNNFPLLLSLIIVGSSALVITQMAQLPGLVFWFLLLLSVILNIWGVIGLILHFWVRNVENGK